MDQITSTQKQTSESAITFSNEIGSHKDCFSHQTGFYPLQGYQNRLATLLSDRQTTVRDTGSPNSAVSEPQDDCTASHTLADTIISDLSINHARQSVQTTPTRIL